MEIKLAETLGFCYGVKRAVELAMEAGKNNVDGATLGPLIHNPQVIEELAKEGIDCYEDLSDFKCGQTVIIRSHGVGPEVYENAKAKGLDILDATCPNVRLAQKKAKECADAGYLPIIVGEKNHPEVKSILKWAGKNGICVEYVEDTCNVPQFGRYGVVIQTTFELAKFEAILESLQKTHPGEYRVERTICLATSKRQAAARDLAKECDLVIVMGGKSSANTRHLYELVKTICPKTYHVETHEELDPAWFTGSNKIGITAGASTPDRLIKEAINKMENMENMDFESMLNAQEEVEVFPGKTVEGTVIQVDKEGIYVSFGYRHDGIISYSEWSATMTPEEIQATVKVGDEVEAQVMKSNVKSEFVRLSKIKAERDAAWKTVAPLEEGEKRKANVKVLRVIKNKSKAVVGLAVSVEGVEGFMPASHVALRRVEDFAPFVGQELEVEIIEVDLDKKRIVVSRRELLIAKKKEYDEQKELRHQQIIEDRKAKKEAAFEQVEEGAVYVGKVKKVVEFGLFVEILDGLTGLVHQSELSWDRKVKPADVAEVGQEVQVLVKSVDRENDRVALSIKATLEDPWKIEASQFNVGDVLEVEVVRLLQFGAIVKLNEKVEGLVNISEIAPQRIEKPEDVLAVGQKVMAKIIKMDLDAKKIGLSINKIKKDAEEAEMRSFMGGKKGGLSQNIDIEA